MAYLDYLKKNSSGSKYSPKKKSGNKTGAVEETLSAPIAEIGMWNIGVLAAIGLKTEALVTKSSASVFKMK